MRDDFLSIAGHELKTPLAALELQLQGLERAARRGAFGPDGKCGALSKATSTACAWTGWSTSSSTSRESPRAS